MLQESPLIKAGQCIYNGIIHSQLSHVVVDVKLTSQLTYTFIDNSGEPGLTAGDALDGGLKDEEDLVTESVCDHDSVLDNLLGLSHELLGIRTLHLLLTLVLLAEGWVHSEQVSHYFQVH